MSSTFRIGIVGGGPAGLSLGVLLHKQSIPFTIFELQRKPTNEDLEQPAGSLDLHEGSGLDAIKACGLYEEFLGYIGDCSEDQFIATKHGEVIFRDIQEDGNRPEISRNKINKMLMFHIPEDSIKWAHKLKSATSSEINGRVETILDFGAEGKYSFDLVIGADGAWSKVRPLVMAERPVYTGLQAVNLNIRNFSSKYPHLAQLCGKGTFAALGDRMGVATQPSMNDAVRVYLFISTPDENFAVKNSLADKTPAEAKHFLLNEPSLFQSWGDNLKELIAICCDDETAHNPTGTIDIKPLCKLQRGQTWPHKSGVTLIGDAAHLMNPPAGEGVNIAMQDSLLVSKAIATGLQGATQDIAAAQRLLSPLLQEFEKDMSVRAAQMADNTLQINKIMFGNDDGATAMKNFFESFGLGNHSE